MRSKGEPDHDDNLLFVRLATKSMANGERGKKKYRPQKLL
jgi:hypothetical protein